MVFSELRKIEKEVNVGVGVGMASGAIPTCVIDER